MVIYDYKNTEDLSAFENTMSKMNEFRFEIIGVRNKLQVENNSKLLF